MQKRNQGNYDTARIPFRLSDDLQTLGIPFVGGFCFEGCCECRNYQSGVTVTSLRSKRDYIGDFLAFFMKSLSKEIFSLN